MDAVKVIRLALSVLTDRLLIILAQGLAFGLAIWVMWYPDPLRLGTMTVFVIFAYLLLRIKESKHEVTQETQ